MIKYFLYVLGSVGIILAVFLYVRINEKDNTKNELVSARKKMGEQSDKIFIPLREVAFRLKQTEREQEGRILLNVLESDSIYVIKNENSSMVRFEKPIKVLSKLDGKEKYIVVMSIQSKNDGTFIKIAVPYSYSFSNCMIKGGIGWNILMSESKIQVSSLEF